MTDIKDIARYVSDVVMVELGRELHKGMAERIIAVSLDKWRSTFLKDEDLSKLISDEMDKLIKEKYKPIIDYIADKKVREKVLRRAEQNGIPREEVEQLMLEMGEEDATDTGRTA